MLLLSVSACAVLSDPRVQSVASLILDVAEANFPGQVAPIRNLVSVIAGFDGASANLPDVGGGLLVRTSMVEKKATGYTPISNGARLDSGSEFAIFLQTEGATENLHVWVVSIDPTGWPQPLFPIDKPGYRNPVPPNAAIRLPGATDDYGLDQVKGTHNIYLVVSRQPNPGLDAVLRPFEGRERPPVQTRGTETIQQAVVFRPGASNRGVTNTRPGQAPAGAGAVGIDLFTAAKNVERVQTSWFIHE